METGKLPPPLVVNQIDHLTIPLRGDTQELRLGVPFAASPLQRPLMSNVMHNAMSVFEEKPISVHHTIAEYYWLDARDFLSRFDALWEVETNKTGRIKTFVDLMMGCECVLKAHVMLGMKELCPKEAYSTLRGASHKVSALAEAAQLNRDRSDYNFLKNELSDFSIRIRYSLDAYDTFFPMLCNWSEADINHSKTIGSHQWVMSVRNTLSRLIENLNTHFTGLVSSDLAAIFENEAEVKAVITGYKK